MRIGIDFDNTLIDYDRVFVAAARERGLVSRDFSGGKRAVREAIRLLPDGEFAWQRLQGFVYGSGIGGAVLFPGATSFLARCRDRRLDVYIVSHKTRFGHFDARRVDLRAAALRWMAAQGFFASDVGGITVDHVYFEDDRARKLARIATIGCTDFIDDLEEVFADSDFPTGVRRILFGADTAPHCDIHCRDWRQVAAAIFGDAG